MEEILQQIADELSRTTKLYDWLILAVSMLSVIVAAVVAVFTYKIYNRQLKLMEEQKTISDTQTSLSEKQTDIMEKQKTISEKQTEISEKQTNLMEQQNKIALFEKRYEAYSCFVDLYMLGQKFSTGNKDVILAFEEKDECFDSRNLSYLFNEDIHSKCNKLLRTLKGFIRHRQCITNNIEPTLCLLPKDKKTISDLSKDIDFYKLCEEMQKYLEF